MALIKCPRCELNYIEEGEGYCKICKREMKGERQPEEVEMCTVCNEHPVLPGKDVCLFCYKEMNADNDRDELDEEAGVVMDSSALSIDPVSTMDEIIPDIEDDDIPPREYSEIENDLSLEEMADEQADDDDEDEDEEDR